MNVVISEDGKQQSGTEFLNEHVRRCRVGTITWKNTTSIRDRMAIEANLGWSYLSGGTN